MVFSQRHLLETFKKLLYLSPLQMGSQRINI